MRVMITGATGFVGGHAMSAAVDAGHEVVPFVRNPAKFDRMLDVHGLAPIEPFVGDVTDAGAVADALEGCDAVLHTAATVSLDPAASTAMAEENHRATRVVLEGALHAGCDPIIHTSSISALFPSPHDVMRASDPIPEATTAYAASKAASERSARERQDDGEPVVIVYPGGVVGPIDAGSNVTAQGMLKALSPGFIPVVSRGGLSYVDVRDLAQVFVRLLEPGRGPRRFMAGGTFVDWEANAELIKVATGRDWKARRIPARVLEMMGRAGDAMTRIRKDWTPPIGHEAAQAMTRAVPTDDRAVHDELGVEYRPVQESLDDMVAWLVTSGQVPAEWAPRWA